MSEVEPNARRKKVTGKVGRKVRKRRRRRDGKLRSVVVGVGGGRRVGVRQSERI